MSSVGPAEAGSIYEYPVMGSDLTQCFVLNLLLGFGRVACPRIPAFEHGKRALCQYWKPPVISVLFPLMISLVGLTNSHRHIGLGHPHAAHAYTADVWIAWGRWEMRLVPHRTQSPRKRVKCPMRAVILRVVSRRNVAANHLLLLPRGPLTRTYCVETFESAGFASQRATWRASWRSTAISSSESRRVALRGSQLYRWRAPPCRFAAMVFSK